MSLTPPDQDLIGIINQIEKDLDEVQFYISGESLGENGPSVPSGGTTGQALIKASNTDGDTVWQTVDINSVTVGTTTTGSPGTSASVTNSGTANELILDFVIPKGDKGDTGDTGPQGPAYATVSVGSVTTGNAGTNASITNSGTSSAAVFNFTIPRGDKGDTGDAATISVGTVTTTASGTTASVVNSGTSGEAVFDFEIPRGEKGDT